MESNETTSPNAIAWRVPEYEKHERDRKWYAIAGVFMALCLVYSYFTANFLFAIILVVAAIVMVLNENNDPQLVDIVIGDEGILVGKNFYDYDEFDDFSIIYKPNLDVRNLYFEFKNRLRHRISIPLYNMNPLLVRQQLKRFLREDLERTDQPASEGLAKLLKL